MIKVSEQIIEVLEYIGQKLGVAIDWSSENVMPVITNLCTKYIKWEISTSIVWLSVGFLIMLSVILWLIFYIKCTDKDDLWDFDYCVQPYFLIILGGMLFIIGLITVIPQIFDIIKCCAFPELKIYEYVRYLLQTLN